MNIVVKVGTILTFAAAAAFATGCAGTGSGSCGVSKCAPQHTCKGMAKCKGMNDCGGSDSKN